MQRRPFQFGMVARSRLARSRRRTGHSGLRQASTSGSVKVAPSPPTGPCGHAHHIGGLATGIHRGRAVVLCHNKIGHRVMGSVSVE